MPEKGERMEEKKEMCPMKKKRSFCGKRDDSGVAVIEIILILVVLIALVVIFKEQALSLVQKIWNSVTGGAGKVTN